jgi:hypothetical protein
MIHYDDLSLTGTDKRTPSPTERISDHRGLPKDRLIQIDWRTSEEDGRLVDMSPDVRPHPDYSAVNLVMMRFEPGAARDSKYRRVCASQCERST